MKEIKTLKYVVLVCMGMTFWVPPCYSFGFPTFDIAEVGATIKGIVSDVQSYASTVQSTITESKLLQSLGDATSAFSKFKDAKAEAERLKEKAERIKKSAERLEKLRKRVQEEMDNLTGEDEQEAPAPASESGAAPEENWDEGQWDTGDDTSSETPSDGPVAPTFNPENDTVDDEDLWGGNEESPASAPQTPATQTVETPNQATLPENQIVDEPLDLWGGSEESLPAKAPAVAPKVVDNKQLLNDSDTSVIVGSKPKSPVLNVRVPQIQQRVPFQKDSSYIEYDMYSDKSSFASMGVKTGTTEEGRFLFSDIIALKCKMDYNDAKDPENVKQCFKAWVVCLAGCKETDLTKCNTADAQACLKEYKQAMQDQVAASLAASLGDKEYSASFDSDVADDLSNKSQALSTERDEVAYGGEVGRASQEVLNRLLYSMSSEVLQNSFLAIEHIKKEYYNEDAE